MLQRNFKHFFLEETFDFLWRQWSALGVAGGARGEEKWVIDPEALLIFSLQMARYEPRLFDEILDWLAVNGKWLDIHRLRGILKDKNDNAKRLLSAAALYLSHEPNSYRRKWRMIRSFRKIDASIQNEILFITKQGDFYPKPHEEDDAFSTYGYLRESFSLRRMSKSVFVNATSNIRFLLRALFGIGSRAECILYLLTHDGGHPNEVAKAIGISVKGTQDALIELGNSGLVLTRIKGKRKVEYWLSQKKWWEFLTRMNYEEIDKPVWLDWIALFSALMSVWEALNEADRAKSEYMRSSKLREAMEKISFEFEKSNLDIPAIPDKTVRPEQYEAEFQKFVSHVLGAKSGTSG